METENIKNVPHIFRVVISMDYNDADYKDFWSKSNALDFFNALSLKNGVSLTLTELKPSTNGSWVFYKLLKGYINPNE